MIENNEQTELQTPPPAYFGSLTIENVKCFKSEQTINLSDKNGNPALWTVILGNSNTGKTTLLRCLASLEAVNLEHKSLAVPENLFSPKCFGKDNMELKEGYYVNSSILFESKIENNYIYTKLKDDWGYEYDVWYSALIDSMKNFIIYGYGTSRRIGSTSITNNEEQGNTETLFNDNLTLVNVEEFIIQTDYASKNGIESAKFRLEKIKQILTNGLLPDVKDINCRSIEENNQIKNFVEFETDYGFVKLRELGYGYQTTLAWIVDLAKKLFERYPNSENPLHEPAIVLIDELDLHLHPEWQRKIIKFLSEQFPKTQFIATTHSPLIVQSADNINLILLEKEEDHVIIKQPDLTTYKGWTVEEILDELMGLGENTVSDSYLEYMEEFGQALDEENYYKAKSAYNKLDKILHPTSHQRKLLRLQMSGLIPEVMEANHD